MSLQDDAKRAKKEKARKDKKRDKDMLCLVGDTPAQHEVRKKFWKQFVACRQTPMTDDDSPKEGKMVTKEKARGRSENKKKEDGNWGRSENKEKEDGNWGRTENKAKRGRSENKTKKDVKKTKSGNENKKGQEEKRRERRGSSQEQKEAKQARANASASEEESVEDAPQDTGSEPSETPRAMTKRASSQDSPQALSAGSPALDPRSEHSGSQRQERSEDSQSEAATTTASQAAAQTSQDSASEDLDGEELSEETEAEATSSAAAQPSQPKSTPAPVETANSVTHRTQYQRFKRLLSNPKRMPAKLAEEAKTEASLTRPLFGVASSSLRLNLFARRAAAGSSWTSSRVKVQLKACLLGLSPDFMSASGAPSNTAFAASSG